MTGNPGTGKTHTAIGLGIKACEQGYRVLYTTIPYLVTELKESNSKQKLRTYQKRFEKYDLIILMSLVTYLLIGKLLICYSQSFH